MYLVPAPGRLRRPDPRTGRADAAATGHYLANTVVFAEYVGQHG